MRCLNDLNQGHGIARIISFSLRMGDHDEGNDWNGHILW